MILLVFQRTSTPTHWSFIVIVFWTINVTYLWHKSRDDLYGLTCKQVACSAQRNKCRSRKINEIISYSVIFISQITYSRYHRETDGTYDNIGYYDIYVRLVLISSIYYTSVRYRLRTIVYNCVLWIIDGAVTRRRFYMKFRSRLCFIGKNETEGDRAYSPGRIVKNYFFFLEHHVAFTKGLRTSSGVAHITTA